MDIVERLEQRRPVSMKEAAEEIRKLQAQLSRFKADARKEIAKGNARESVLYEKCEDWRMEAIRLQAANERLRANADENEALRAQLDHVTITYKAEMQEAAEKLREVQADNKRLKSLLENSEMTVAEVIDANERLRNALRQVAEWPEGTSGYSPDDAQGMVDVGQAALSDR